LKVREHPGGPRRRTRLYLLGLDRPGFSRPDRFLRRGVRRFLAGWKTE
jgi:hypothetical protein